MLLQNTEKTERQRRVEKYRQQVESGVFDLMRGFYWEEKHDFSGASVGEKSHNLHCFNESQINLE
jgi:hypothetical protein